MPAQKPFRKSLMIALRGAIEASVIERNLKIQWGVATVVVVAGLFFQVSLLEWCCLVLCMGGVISAEVMNTAIESLVDLLEPQQREAARKAKDFAAGSVLIISVAACLVGGFIFWSHLMLWLKF